MKGLQSAYMAVLLVPRVWPLNKSLDPPRIRIYTLVNRPNFFLIKFSKFDKKTLIIYFNGLLFSPLKRSLDNNLSAWPAKCEEPLIIMYSLMYVFGYSNMTWYIMELERTFHFIRFSIHVSCIVEYYIISLLLYYLKYDQILFYYI